MLEVKEFIDLIVKPVNEQKRIVSPFSLTHVHFGEKSQTVEVKYSPFSCYMLQIL